MKKNNFILKIPSGTQFYLPYYTQDLIQKEICSNNNYYEFEILSSLLLKKNGLFKNKLNNGFILDIGANIGNHTLFFFNQAHAKKIYCFEPVKDTFQILSKNIEINNLSNNVVLFNIGVGNQQGAASVKKYSLDNTGMTELAIKEDGDIQILAIDDLHISEPISFVKIDVEGFELEVIKGMANTLKKHHPAIMIEIREQFYKDINDILERLNYTYLHIDENKNGINNYLYYQRNEK